MTQAEGLVGKQIDQYRIESHIASGGMAAVYMAYDTMLERPVCLKTILPELSHHEELMTRFRREATAAANLAHPHIMEIFEVGTTPGGQPYIAMAYVQGGSLADLIVRRRERGELLTAGQTLNILRPIAAALQAVHDAGMVHRDLKPSNILIKRGGAPILADLGIVSVQEATRLTRTGQQLGTPYYMAPEQVRGGRVDGRTDLYAFGVILYEMLGGERPFSGANGMEIMHQHLAEEPIPLKYLNRNLAAPTYRLVERCLAKDPDERFPDTAAFIAALDQAIAAEEGQASSPLPSDPQPRDLPSSSGPTSPAIPPPAAEETMPDPAPGDRPWLQGRRGRVYALVALVVFIGLGLFLFGRNGETDDGETAVIPGENGQLAEQASSSFLPTPSRAARATSTLSGALPTNTPRPTATATATSIPSATPRPTNTPRIITPASAVSENAGSESAVTCRASPGDRWGDTLYAVYGERLGCPITGEIRTNGAYQKYQNGLAVWREDVDRVYFLLYTGTYLDYPATVAPAGYYDTALLKGAFGYYWNNNATVRGRLGQPVEAEAVANQFAAQDFSQGAIFYFLENGANNYVLFANSGAWLATPR